MKESSTRSRILKFISSYKSSKIQLYEALSPGYEALSPGS